MSQPPPYVRQHDFSDFSAANPDDQQSGVWIDDEFNAVKVTADALNANIAMLQKDDGALKNGIVTYDSLATATKALLGSNVTPRGDWVTATSYAVLDMVTHSGITYVCSTAHTSGTFATDLAAFKWLLFASPTSSGDMTTLDFSTLTEDTTPDLANDLLLSYDASTAANKKVKPVNLLSAFTSQYVATIGGTANAITLTPSPAVTAYAAGQKFRFLASAANTSGTVTINVSALGNKTVKKIIGESTVALAVHDIKNGKFVEVFYDGTNFFLTAPRANSQGADIASASTINLSTATGDYVHVTGTTTITAITIDQGQERTAVFDDIITLTNGASLVLPGNANITTTAGDSCVFRGEASSVVRCISYTRANGSPIVGAALGLTLLATSTPSGVTIVDLTSIPATYRALYLTWSGISCNTASRTFLITPDCGAGLGSESCAYLDSTNTVVSGQGGTAQMFIGYSQAAAATIAGSLYIPNYASSGFKQYMSGQLSSVSSITTNSAGNILSTGAVQGLRCYWSSSGTFDAGTINLYGVS